MHTTLSRIKEGLAFKGTYKKEEEEKMENIVFKHDLEYTTKE